MQSLAFLTGSAVARGKCWRRAALLFGILPALLLLTLFVGSAPDAAAQTTRTITMSIAGAGPPAGFTYPTMNEGGSVGQRTLRFTLDSAAPAGGIDMGSPGTAPNGNTQVISTLIAEGQTSIDYGIHPNDDAVDRPNYAYVQIYPNSPNTPGVTFTVVPADRTILLTVVDNDPTEVTLTRVDTGEDTLYEGDTAQFEVSLSRPLVGAGDHGPAEVIAVPLRILQTEDAVTTSDWSITLDEDSPNTGVSLGSSVASSGGDFAHQVVTFSGAGAQTAVLKVAAENDSGSEPDEAITISLASNADFDGPTHGSATNVGGGADPHVTGSPPETDRFMLTIRDGSRPRPILFRTCPDGVTCSTSSDAGWVESERPLVQLVEGGGTVTYQYKLTGHPNQGDVFGEASVRIEDTRKKGPQNVGVGLADWDRIRCHRTDDHGTMTEVGVSSSILVTSATSISTTQWHDLFGGCPYHANGISWAERDGWQTVTYSAGHDADAYDEAIVLEHRVRTTAPGGGYVYDGPPGQEGIGPTQQRKVTPPAYGPGYVDLRIVDDDDWDQEFLYSGDGGATWTKASDGGLQKAIPDELEAGATHDVHIKLLNPSLASHRSRDYIYVKVGGCGDRFGSPVCDIGVSPNSYGNDRPSSFTDFDWGSGLDVNAAANASVRLRLHVKEDAEAGTRKTISFWNYDWLRRTDTDLPDPSLRQPGPNRNTASRYISGFRYEETRVVEIVAGSEQEQALPPTLTIASAATSVTEGGDVTFTISANPAPQFDVTVNIAADEEMGSGIDLVASSHLTTIIFPAWQSSTTWTLTTYSDEVALADGTVVGRIMPDHRTPSGYTVGAPSSVTLTLVDDDPVAADGIRGGAPEDSPPPTYTADPQVIAAVEYLASQTHHGTAHVNRWQRALVALGALDPAGVTGGALTLAEARQNANTYSSPVWNQVVAELEAKAAFEAAQQTQQTPPPTPEVNITSAAGGSEGSSVTFTVSANPAPTADLAVSVTVATTGDYGVTAGSRTVTIAGGATSATLTLPTADDSTDEADGSVTLTLNGGSGYTVGQLSSETAQVQDDDDPQQQQPEQPVVIPVVSVTAGSGVIEGGNASFTITANPAPTSALSVSVTVSASGDYGATTGSRTVTIPTGGSATFTVATTDDSADEADGSVTATVNAGNGYTVSSSQGAATGSVADDDVPVVSITAGSGVTEGGDASFTITASPVPAADLTVNVTVTASGDYGATTGQRTVTVPTTGSATLTVGTTDDSADEADGSVTATLVDGADYDLGTNQAATVSVADDDAPPVVTPVVSISGGNGVTEGGNASFTITASPVPAADLSVSVTVTASGDYGATTGQRTVTVPTTGSATFTVATTNDGNDEADGSVTATLVDGADYDLGTNRAATVSVADDDVPVVSITAGSGVTEGGNASFTIIASPVPAADLSVSVTVSASGDYGATTGSRTVTIPTAGSATFTVGTTDDGNDEADGSVTATLVDGADYDLGTNQAATVSVSDNDDAPPVETAVTISIEDASASENDADLFFQVTLSEASNEDVTVQWATSHSQSIDRARGGQGYDYDFWHAIGEIVIRAGETSGTGAVWLNQDSKDEPDEVFTVTLSSPVGAALEREEATMTIIDDD